MRTLERNKSTFYYALYNGKTELVDENGCKTGEYGVSYSTPVKMRANISPSKGKVYLEQYGLAGNYTRVILTDDVNCPISEDSILWIDRPITEPHNYVVECIGKSLNSVAIAIRDVVISNADNG